MPLENQHGIAEAFQPQPPPGARAADLRMLDPQAPDRLKDAYVAGQLRPELACLAGDFTANGKTELLRYYRRTGDWCLGDVDAVRTPSPLAWRQVGNTWQFGDLTRGAIRFFVGNFTGQAGSEALFYCGSDGNWWLGRLGSGARLDWSLIGNTAGFGDLTRAGIRFFVGQFTRRDRIQLLFYCAGDGNWWLGEHDAGALRWVFAGNAAGFGSLVRPAIRFFTGEFTDPGRTDILFYCANDGNWWLGSLATGQLQWTLASNTVGFGDLTRPAIRLFTDDFSGQGRTDVLFYCANDGNWWQGRFGEGRIGWSLAGNTAGFGDLTRASILLFTGRFSNGRCADVLFYCANDGNWWLGSFATRTLTWFRCANTAGFGDLTRHAIQFAGGDFGGDLRRDLLFHCQDDGNWWYGRLAGTSLEWRLGRAGEAVAGFLPSTSGLHFGNGYPDGTPYPILTLPVVGTIASGDAGDGLCGGFAFTVLDLYLSSPRRSPPTDTARPPPGTPRFNYLTQRLIDSFGPLPGLNNTAKLVDWIQSRSHDVEAPFMGPGLAHKMIKDEWPTIKADIDAGMPSPMTIVGPPGCGALDIPGIIVALGRSHQVLAYAYGIDGNRVELRIYDCNDPDNDHSTLAFDIGDPKHTLAIDAPDLSRHLGHAPRAFFRTLSYGYRTPSGAW